MTGLINDKGEGLGSPSSTPMIDRFRKFMIVIVSPQNDYLSHRLMICVFPFVFDVHTDGISL